MDEDDLFAVFEDAPPSTKTTFSRKIIEEETTEIE